VSSLYYAPEKYGLRIHKNHDRIGGYEYDQITIFADDATGRYLIGQSSGCSCTTPFEEYSGPDDLDEVRTMGDVLAFARAHVCWSEDDVARLVEDLRLDGLPSVVDGSVVGSEPALPAAPEPRAPEPEPPFTDPRELVAAALDGLPVTASEKAAIEELVTVAEHGTLPQNRRDAAQALADLLVSIYNTHMPCGECGTPHSCCRADQDRGRTACCSRCVTSITHRAAR
jgi:hypothetical protein